MTETQVVRCMERAAVHQIRALGYLRDVYGPHAAPDAPQARTRLVWALEHAVQARSLLQQARAGAACLDLADELDRHLARLDCVATAVTRRLQELDGALDQSQC